MEKQILFHVSRIKSILLLILLVIAMLDGDKFHIGL